MGAANWDARYRRTGFYTVVKKDGRPMYQQPVNYYLVQISGGLSSGVDVGVMIEPADSGLAVPTGAISTTSHGMAELYWEKCDEIFELGMRMNQILEDKQGGDSRPVPLHQCSFSWPLT